MPIASRSRESSCLDSCLEVIMMEIVQALNANLLHLSYFAGSYPLCTARAGSPPTHPTTAPGPVSPMALLLHRLWLKSCLWARGVGCLTRSERGAARIGSRASGWACRLGSIKQGGGDWASLLLPVVPPAGIPVVPLPPIMMSGCEPAGMPAVASAAVLVTQPLTRGLKPYACTVSLLE
jgi:hypothetical protein